MIARLIDGVPRRALVLLGIVVAVQLGLFVAWTAFGAGPDGESGFGALGGDWALFVCESTIRGPGNLAGSCCPAAIAVVASQIGK